MAVDPLVACLLPARNAFDDLPQYFESVARFADAVVALDDGSSDDTYSLLASQPLVRILRRNPPRNGSEGWDDAANRNRLLSAAAELRPKWIMQLDADERISADDADALRGFVESEADERHAYLFRVFRMIDDLDHYDNAHLWFVRLFAYQPGQTFPTDRLHFSQVPTAIPPDRWRRTTIRLQHLTHMTEARRRERYEKYRQADPARKFQPSYEHLLRTGAKKPWYPRSAHLAVLANSPKRPRCSPGVTPTFSVVVTTRNGRFELDTLPRHQSGIETIVVMAGKPTSEVLGRQPSGLTVVGVERRASFGRMRNVGLRLAQGRYVSFLEAGTHYTPEGLAAVVHAHELGYAMVAGIRGDRSRSLVSSASGLLDPDRLTGRGLMTKPPRRCSYLRAALLEVGGFCEDLRVDEAMLANHELFARGYSAWRPTDSVLDRQRAPRIGPFVADELHSGRAEGRLIWWTYVDSDGFPGRKLTRTVQAAMRSKLGLLRRLHGTRSTVLTLLLAAAGIVVYCLGVSYEVLRALSRCAFAGLHVTSRRARSRGRSGSRAQR